MTLSTKAEAGFFRKVGMGLSRIARREQGYFGSLGQEMTKTEKDLLIGSAGVYSKTRGRRDGRMGGCPKPGRRQSGAFALKPWSGRL